MITIGCMAMIGFATQPEIAVMGKYDQRYGRNQKPELVFVPYLFAK